MREAVESADPRGGGTAVESREAIIIGAGPSGLAAAERLHEAQVDFAVLEARPRIGGRVWTNYELLPDTPVEMGALMVHGRHVATHAWAREVGIELRPYPTTWRARFFVDGTVTSTYRFGLPRPGPFGLRPLIQGLRTVPRALETYSGPEVPLSDFLDERSVAPAARSIVELLHAHTWAADPTEIGVLASAKETAGSHEPYGFRNFQVRDGYSELARRKSLPFAGRIHLGRPAEVVHWTDSGVRVEARSIGGGATGEIRADRAIVTVPLGVLRAGGLVFDPPLPASHQEAIRRLGFGRAASIAIRFRRGNLKDRLGRFVLLWGGTASTFLRPGFDRHGERDVIVAFAVGEDAARRAALSDREMVDATVAELRGILPPGADPGTPDGWAISRWATDPFLLGAYSFPALGASPEDRRTLAQGLGGRVFFAGEATALNGDPATVHGAIETGRRAASELLAARRRARI